MADTREPGRQLEDAFFLKEDQKLIEKYKKLKELEATKKKLSELSGIKDDAKLQRMIDLNIRPETLLSLVMVPLVEVAWADGEVDEKERRAILSAAEKKGINKGGVEHDVLERWLAHKPDPKLLETWIDYTRELCRSLQQANRVNLKDDLLGRARGIAEAAGGFLGMGNKISEAEEAMLRKLETAFEEGSKV
jgi:uncharacterized tellurite resistance protein B-like protein